MNEHVKGRRKAQADATRAEVLSAAARLFLSDGYVATTISDIAEEAGVAVQTIYNSVGGKARLLEGVLGMAAAGDAGPDDVVRRELARGAAITDPVEFLDRAARSASERLARVVPALAVVHAAASSGDAAAGELAARIAEQRLTGLRVMVRELKARGGLRRELTEDAAAAIAWSLASPEAYQQFVLVQRWSPTRFRRWLADAWTAALAEASPPRRTAVSP